MSDDDRPNLLAAVSVALGALGIASLGCFALLAPPIAIAGLVTGFLARKQAQQTGYGADYAWWGLVLGGVNLTLGTLYGLVMGALWMS